MILSPFSRQQTALRLCRSCVAQTQCLYNPKSQRRRKHYVPQLTHDQAFIKDGIPGMLSMDGFATAWHDYQGHIVERLNQLTAGTKYADKPTHEILLATARDPSMASLFNHASMAWNNHQFFSTLSPTPTAMSPLMIEKVTSSFSSPESLRKTFVATAAAMFGPGFVWLVKRNSFIPTSGDAASPELSILTTYLAGSPLSGAHNRRQDVDTNTMSAGGFGPMSQIQRFSRKNLAPGGADVEVLLGCNTWEHTWMMDWGIRGKRDYVEGWWAAVDWAVVEESAKFDAYKRPDVKERLRHNLLGARARERGMPPP